MSEIEQINFEYKVSFDKGLRPVICVYGVDTVAKKFYGSEAYIGVYLTTGNEISLQPKKSGQDLVPVISRVDGLRTISSINDFLDDIPKKKNWESAMERDYRKNGRNLVKVQRPQEVLFVLDRHTKLYTAQFEVLKDRLSEQFEEFARNNPDHVFYN